MSAKLKSIIAHGTRLTAAIAVAGGLSACVTAAKSGLSNNAGKAPAPVTVASMPPSSGAVDPMAVDPLYAPPPPTTSQPTSSAVSASGESSERVPLGQLSGSNANVSQRVPLGALSKPQPDTKSAVIAKATSAPLLIAPNAGTSSVSPAMNSQPPAPAAPTAAPAVPSPPAPAAAAPAPAAKLPPVKSEAMAPPPPATSAAVASAPSASSTTQKALPKLKIPPVKGVSSPSDSSLRDEDTVVISSTSTITSKEAAHEFIPAPLTDTVQPDSVGGSLIDRPMTAAEKNIAQRFDVLKTLLDEGLITPEEYSRHRAANIGALLPFTHDPGSVGLDRPSASADAIVARLQALRRALTIHAITTEQHASERAMILMALLPAHPEELAAPTPPPADVIQGASMMSRLQTLKTRGLISADEYDDERKVVDQYLRTGSFKGGAAVADREARGKENPAGVASATKEVKGGKKEAAPAAASAGGGESDTAEVNGPVLHLASFRTKEGAEKAWQEALGQNKSILGQYHPVIRKIDLGEGKGVFFRLMVGPFTNLAAAESTCIRLKANNQFCRASSSANGS